MRESRVVRSRGVEGIFSGLESLEKQQRFHREKEGSDEHLESFWNKMAVRVVCEFFWFKLRVDGERGGGKVYSLADWR